TLDPAGNLYLLAGHGPDAAVTIYKITPSGTVSRFAGNGGVNFGYYAGYFGVGGIPTEALFAGAGIAADGLGNVYIEDWGPWIWKVSPSGILTNFAGNGISGYSGDGGPATAAAISSGFNNVAADAAGNVYIADAGYGVIRKVDQSGIITTIAGNGTPGYSG